MLYDCFIFSNELDLLELRLHELDHVVDKFVICEATTTFTGNKKPLYFDRNRRRFAKFKDKIVHLVITDLASAPPASSLPYFRPTPFQHAHPAAWSKEIYQRNSLKRALESCKPHDLVMISDVDEIPRAKTIAKLKRRQKPVTLEQTHYYYFLNCRGDQPWREAKLCRYRDLIDPQLLRQDQTLPIIPRAGWHFSFLGGGSAVKQKLAAYSHQEHNRPEVRRRDWLDFNLKNALDLFERPFTYRFVNLDSSYPLYLRQNLTKYRQYLFHDPHQDDNTARLRKEVFRLRSRLYWLQQEREQIIRELLSYQAKYRQAVKFNPLFYLFTKFFSAKP